MKKVEGYFYDLSEVRFNKSLVFVFLGFWSWRLKGNGYGNILIFKDFKVYRLILWYSG